MKMIATRELASNSGKVMNEVHKNGFVVITKDGKPRSIIISTTEETLIPDIRSVMNLKFKQVLRDSQARALANGSSKMSMRDIDGEISKARKLRPQ